MPDKAAKLREIIKGYGKAAVAFSGGVDSTLLLKLCCDILGNNVIAITLDAPVVPEEEKAEADEICRMIGAKQIKVRCDSLKIEGFADNPVNRCYICKKAMFGLLQKTAEDNGFATVIDGSNADDTGDYRPGMKALEELNIASPLMEAGMTKEDVRRLSKELELPTWNKPAYACLASRIPYGDIITEEKLNMIERAESCLHNLGIRQNRVRLHGNIARIEVAEEGMDKVMADRYKIDNELRSMGFDYVALDLKGYRTGSLNESINNESIKDE